MMRRWTPPTGGRHMTQPVRFEAAIQTILQQQPGVLLEIGPGRILSGLATEIIRRRPAIEPLLIDATMRHPRESAMTDARCLLQMLGRLWTAGIAIDWRAFHADARSRRLPLPTYAFERRRCWPDDAITAPHFNGVATPSPATEHQLPLAERFYLPSWQRTLPPRQPQLSTHRWLMFLPGAGEAGALGDMVATRLEQYGHGVQRVFRAGDLPDEMPPAAHIIDDAQAEDYLVLLRQLAADGAYPQRIVYWWGLEREAETAQQTLANVYYPLLRLAQTLTTHVTQEALMLWVITDQAIQVNVENVCPVKATLFGPGLVLPQENLLVSCRMLDVQLSSAPTELAQLADTILSECAAIEPDAEPLVAWRGEHRWRPQYEAVELTASAMGAGLQHAHQTYVITGGLGRIGLALAEHLAMLPSKIVLTTRSAFPARSQWEGIALSSDAEPQFKATVQRLLKCEAAGADLRVIQARTWRRRRTCSACWRRRSVTSAALPVSSMPRDSPICNICRS